MGRSTSNISGQMIDLTTYTNALVEKNGIYFSEKETEISYPESGNEDCFQIEENSFWFKHRNNCITEAVLKYAPGTTFFDIGGGNGFVAKRLESEGVPTVLVEPGHNGCLNAKGRNLQNIVCATLENAEFGKNSIPAIGLFDVVEHIEHDVAFLKTIRDILAENGLVFITVPAYKTLWSNEDVDAGHFRRYTTKQLEDKLAAAGLETVYSTYIFSILILPVFLFRTLPSKLGFNKNSGDAEKHKKEHEANKGIVDDVLNRIWNLELGHIKKGKKLPFGGSCFVVARKK
jgi:SAM-dependent methyltransferase